MEIISYNEGYHRGLNTEYHDEDIEQLYQQWVCESQNIDTSLEEFFHGYEDGLSDYLEWHMHNKQRGT